MGHQQRRSPGAHLSLDHRGRGSQYLGLRGDDQLVQRHPQLQGDPADRLQPDRGPPGRAAAHLQGQGREQRAGHRHRSALHPHRGARRSFPQDPARFRRRDHLGHDVAYLRKRLGRQGIHPPARLRHERRHERSQELEPGRGRARQRRTRRTGLRRGQGDG